MDSEAVVQEVEKYRNDCKSKHVKTLLLAESHAHTSESEFSQFLKKEFAHEDGSRCRLVRFVYCLGASERSVLENPNLEMHRPWQFWRILYSCKHYIEKNEDFLPFDGGTDKERLGQKLKLIEELKSGDGIWLLDASVVGINGLKPAAKARIMKECWSRYVGYNIRQLQELRQIIIIGEAVREALEDELRALHVKTDGVPQPQAQITGGYIPYYKRIYNLCNPK